MPMGQVPMEPDSIIALLSKSVITGKSNAVQCIHQTFCCIKKIPEDLAQCKTCMDRKLGIVKESWREIP